jgi:N-acetyl sugar amidotransferase
MESIRDLPSLSLTDDQWVTLRDLKLEHQLQTQPPSVVFCTKCVLSNQRPRVTFDEHGVCSACNYWIAKETIDWEARSQLLAGILEEHRSQSGNYDVVVPGSGGKDSAYVAHQLKHRWGMNPLTVTWAPHSRTEIGVTNFQNFVHAGFDNLTATPNGLLHRKLTLLSTALVGDNFLPFIWGQVSYALHVAKSFGIPLVFFGENGEAEYGGNAALAELPGMPIASWAEAYWKGVTPSDLLRIGREIDLVTEEEEAHASRFYSPPNLEGPAVAPQHFWYGYFTKWLPQENFFYVAQHTGFKANPEGRSEGTYSKYASLDDRTDGFHYLFSLLKFGLGRATSDAAHEIREGLISREEAIALIQRHEMEFPSRHYDFFLRYSGLAPSQFAGIMDKFRAPHLWRSTGEEWVLRNPIWDEARD